ncbi:MAG: hypothetical protein KIS96_03430 [Bauldia sp.]|nr:hypothetical protein [Bauldia sp.]
MTGTRIDAPAAELALAALAPTVTTPIHVPSVALRFGTRSPINTYVDLTRPDTVYACTLAAVMSVWNLDDGLPTLGDEVIGWAPDIVQAEASTAANVATHPLMTSANDDPPATHFAARLSRISFRRSMRGGDRFGGVAQGDGMLILDNADGNYDERLFQAVAGTGIVVKAGSPDIPFRYWRTIIVGTARDQEFSEKTYSLTMRDDSFRLQLPLRDTLYLGTGGKEGGDALVNKSKPVLLGYRLNIAPPQVDGALLTYQIHDGELDAVFAVRDRGSALSFGEDHANFAALAGATIAGGEYDTCLAEGFIRLGGTPAGQVTVDAATYRSSGKAYLAAILRGVLEDYGPITAFDEPSFTALAAAYPNDHGLWVGENDDATIRDVVERLLDGVAGYVAFSRNGRCRVGTVVEPEGTAAATYGMADIIGEVPHERLPAMLAPPPWRLRLYYSGNDTVQSDLAGAADQVWAQPGLVALASDTVVRQTYEMAQDVGPFDSYMIDEADASAEATRQLDIYKLPRPLRRVGLVRRALVTEIGDLVDVDYDRLGGQRRGIAVEDNIEVGDGIDQVEMVVYG